MADPELKKWIWTDAEFEELPLSDTFVHGIGFDQGHLLLDIDFCCFAPGTLKGEASPDRLYAPATLRFRDVSNAVIKVSPAGGLIILDVERSQPRERKDGGIDWKWDISECCSEGFQFRAAGFDLYVRQAPMQNGDYPACLSLRERGGISFAAEGLSVPPAVP